MEGFSPILLLELGVFGGGALAWGLWEIWQTDRAIRRARDAEQARPGSGSGLGSGPPGHPEGEHQAGEGRP